MKTRMPFGLATQAFVPHPLLRNAHVMTLFAHYWPRRNLLQGMPPETRLFVVAPDSSILGVCHWQPQPQQHPTSILVHGLEGSSESPYMLGMAHKARSAGFNVVRLNQRTCGRTEHLTPTLYNGGLSANIHAVVRELATRDGLEVIWLVGFSLGGNLVLKMAGEVGATLRALSGVAAVCPSIDPAACVEALERRRNWMYHRYFVAHLRARLRRKARLFPDRFDVSPLGNIRTLREFDDAYTAPDGGYASAADYYDRTGAGHLLGTIQVPTLILAAQDDPFVPYRAFEASALRNNPWIQLFIPEHGGHCGFIQRPHPDEDLYWAENRLVEFMRRAAVEHATPAEQSCMMREYLKPAFDSTTEERV